MYESIRNLYINNKYNTEFYITNFHCGVPILRLEYPCVVFFREREISGTTWQRWSDSTRRECPFLVPESYWRDSDHPGRTESVHHCSTPTTPTARPPLRRPVGPQDLVLSNHSHLGRRPRYHFFSNYDVHVYIYIYISFLFTLCLLKIKIPDNF